MPAKPRLRPSAPLRRAVLGLGLSALLVPALGCVNGIPKCRYDSCEPEYALVEYHSSAETGRAPKVEVSSTEVYRNERNNFQVAAIRLPDACENTSAAAATGMARPAATILSTSCGVWLAEIERALSQSGFRVISWDALRQRERQKGISTYEAAKELGAEIIFVFNSLEAGVLQTGGAAGASFRYFASNQEGQKLAALALDDASRAGLRNYIKAREGSANASSVSALSCILDSTVVKTSSGEAIWFIRRTVTQPVSSSAGRRYLFGRTPKTDWKPARPKLAAQQVAHEPQLSTQDVQLVETSARPADVYQAEIHALIRAAAHDFVNNFRQGGN